MASIAIIAPDGNSVVGLSHERLSARALNRMAARVGNLMAVPGIRYDNSVCRGLNWPLRFQLVTVIINGRWRTFDPDYLPAEFW
jgi:hypothetical protein